MKWAWVDSHYRPPAYQSLAAGGGSRQVVGISGVCGVDRGCPEVWMSGFGEVSRHPVNTPQSLHSARLFLRRRAHPRQTSIRSHQGGGGGLGGPRADELWSSSFKPTVGPVRPWRYGRYLYRRTVTNRGSNKSPLRSAGVLVPAGIKPRFGRWTGSPPHTRLEA